MNACGVAVAMLSGNSWAPHSSIGRMVNVGADPGRLSDRASSPVEASPSPTENLGRDGGPVVVRARRSRVHGQGPASRQQGRWNAWRAPVNTDELERQLYWAERRVREIQTKLHRWATSDPHRRFDDLYNLVCDPSFLLVAWDRVRGNTGARTAGVDGQTVHQVEVERGSRYFSTGCASS